MFDFFLNSSFLWVGAALISVPIIIHLINRLRFKRLAWAAMEFLLKAQKKNRRRLIIEQLILLALRCLLVFLVMLLVARFIGVNFGEMSKKQSLHLVLLDDTLSTSDKERETDQDCFQRAQDIIIDKIGKKMTSGDRLMVLPLSKVSSAEDPKAFEKINNPAQFNELREQVKAMSATCLHVSLTEAVQRARKIANADSKSQVTVHILSDYRQKDWGATEGSTLHQELVSFVKERKAKIRLVDTASPDRIKEGSAPRYHDNVGIVELRPNTRVAGKGTPVGFRISVANYGTRETEVNVSIYDDATGSKREEIDFNPQLPLKIKPGATVQASFDMTFTPNLKTGGDKDKNETYFAPITAKLESANNRGPLTGDAIVQDNVAHAVVEVREQVPVLVIDGGSEGETHVDSDSFFLDAALSTVTGSSYRVDFAKSLPGSGGQATSILDRPADLRKYPTLFILNLRDLTPKRLENLETYVSEGGGVGFFLGPQVSKEFYNEFLFKNGTGIFPVQLKDAYEPPSAQNPDTVSGNTPMLLLRDDLFPVAAGYPIFGSLFKDASRRDALNDLPVKRYFQVVRAPDTKKVQELATLPNELPIKNYQNEVLAIVRMKQEGQPDSQLEKILAGAEFQKYKRGLDKHRVILERLVAPPWEQKTSALAKALHELITDKGKTLDTAEKAKGLDQADYPNLTEFWANADPNVQNVLKELTILRDQARYGDPFVLASSYGKGKVVAVMTTAGKRWNSWAGGSQGTATYLPFVWEMQNYLSSQNSDAYMNVGTPWSKSVDSEQLKVGSRQLKMTRYRIKPKAKEKYEKVDVIEQTGKETLGKYTFSFAKNDEPGVYLAQLFFVVPNSADELVESWGQVFNVDTVQEGQLQRVGYEDVKSGILDKCDGNVTFQGTGVSGDDLVPRRSDFSESPLLFLVFLSVLVAEQALAVHLSFHMKGSENQPLPPRV